jgi:hypothetical protein
MSFTLQSSSNSKRNKNSCVAYGCTSVPVKDPNLHFHRFEMHMLSLLPAVHMDNAIWDLNNRVFSTMPIDHLHRFPKDTALKQRWAEKIKRKNWKPTSNSVLCSRHFDTSCYQVPPGVGRKVRLFPDALPTNFPEFPEHMKPVSAKSGKKPRKVPASRVPSTINQAPTAEPAALVEPICAISLAKHPREPHVQELMYWSW